MYVAKNRRYFFIMCIILSVKNLSDFFYKASRDVESAPIFESDLYIVTRYNHSGKKKVET